MRFIHYYKRIIPAYILKRNSQLTFWHEKPAVNLNAFQGTIGQYYMSFKDKANYSGPFDKDGIPLLNYKGKIGIQYNPITVAQYGLGNYNLYKKNKNNFYYQRFIKCVDWLVKNLEANSYDIKVWNHKFDWEYSQTLKAPWYSALAQGQGISLLVRAYIETKKSVYLDTASEAFRSLRIEINKGGLLFIDENNNWWLEEYIVNPPTHILNGFIWALWGVYDYFLLEKDAAAKQMWNNCLDTLQNNLYRYDIGFWSLYDLSLKKKPNLASYFYHELHIVQLDILYRLSQREEFRKYKEKWEGYLCSRLNKVRAYYNKAIFKLRYF